MWGPIPRLGRRSRRRLRSLHSLVGLREHRTGERLLRRSAATRGGEWKPDGLDGLRDHRAQRAATRRLGRGEHRGPLDLVPLDYSSCRDGDLHHGGKLVRHGPCGLYGLCGRLADDSGLVRAGLEPVDDVEPSRASGRAGPGLLDRRRRPGWGNRRRSAQLADGARHRRHRASDGRDVVAGAGRER